MTVHGGLLPVLAGHLPTNSPVGLPCLLATMNSELRTASTCSSGLARLCCMFASRCSEAAAAASFCLISACSRSGDSRVRSRTSFQLRKSERSRANTIARARGGLPADAAGRTILELARNPGGLPHSPFEPNHRVLLRPYNTLPDTSNYLSLQ